MTAVVVNPGTQPRSRMAGGGFINVMETVAGYILGILVVGIILGVFVIISSMQFNINGTRYTLIPAQLAALGQSTTMTLVSIIVVVAIVVLLIPIVKYLMDVFGRGGGR